MQWPLVETPVRRTMDATFLNTVANDPSVRPWLGGDGPLELSAQINNPLNLAGVSAEGGFVAQSLGDCRYEVHSLFLPVKKTGAVKAMRAALDYIFSASDAMELITKVPDDNTSARGLAILAGFRSLFSAQMPWSAGVRKLIDVRVIELDEWALRSQAALESGQWLHRQFADVLTARGSVLPPHSAKDDVHDRMAGAAMLMIRTGNIAKGVLFYNRWAALAGYPLIKWLRDHPTILDLEGMIVEISGDRIEVLTCQ